MIAKHKGEVAQSAFYQDSLTHLRDELQRLDRLIRRHVAALGTERLAADGMMASKGLYITREQVDALLDEKTGDAIQPSVSGSKLQDTVIAEKITASAERGIFLSLPWVAQLFSLSELEVQTLVMCLAPELRRKYDTLYAYLQDDITRKRPSVDLVLDVLCTSESERWRARTAVFSEQAPLFRHGILHREEDSRSPSGSSGLAQFLRLDERMLHYILENETPDSRLAGHTTLLHPSARLEQVLVDSALKTRLFNLCQQPLAQTLGRQQGRIFYFHGPYGMGKDLALGLCGQLGRPVLHVDTELMIAREPNMATALRLAYREAVLWDAPIYLDHCDALMQDDVKAKGWVKTLALIANEYGQLTFMAGELSSPPRGVFDQDAFWSVELPMPDVSFRKTAWERALQRVALSGGQYWAGELAGQFRLTPAQIEEAAACLRQERALAGDTAEVTRAELYTACRKQSHHKLAELAAKIEPRHDWDDLVLPNDRRDRLRELCDQVAHRHRVFDSWGFGRKAAHGRGISALFAGPSGTGKTMAADVIAHQLQLDLYKIDLSGVVNKYIGETEKNLAKIFQEAEASNAILFFDEADALFGKRTKISDAHDRYANIETSYLLQRVEAYEGVVILATNLRENMDEAFTRRIKFIIDFPFPDLASRKLIWQMHFPREAPVHDDLDYEWLARQLQITGGNIKNIILNAAFFAAADGGVIRMDHIMRGARGEFEKIGKLWNDKEFDRSQL